MLCNEYNKYFATNTNYAQRLVQFVKQLVTQQSAHIFAIFTIYLRSC